MVIFYKNIIDKIISGAEHNYSQEQLDKLVDWSANDKKTKIKIDKKKKI